MDRKMKILMVINKLAQGYTDKEIIQELNISRRTYFRWKGRIKTEGHGSVIQRKKPGPESYNIITQGLRRKILRWRDRYGWSPVKIEGHLREHCNTKISHRQIYKLLCKTKRNRPIENPRKTWGKKRFERIHSNSLWQADFKLLVNDYWMLTFIDDHARFIVGSNDKIWNPDSESIIKLLKRCFRFGLPEQILTDRGSQFWNNRSGKPTPFTQFCIDSGIQHIVASIRRPTTIGKVESYHSCYDRERYRFKSHRAFISYWNYKRPHGGIGYKYPVEVFYKDIKSASNSG